MSVAESSAADTLGGEREILPEMLSAVRPLVETGAAVMPLAARDKVAVIPEWQKPAAMSFAELQTVYRSGQNLGLRTGWPSKLETLIGGAVYIHGLDIDVRDPAKKGDASAALRASFPMLSVDWPHVISGSGGASRHYYFVTDCPFPKRKIASGEGWEITLYGDGAYLVLPPSIHPITGKAYVWGQELDMAAIQNGAGPFVPSAHIDRLQGLARAIGPVQAKPPVGLSLTDCEGVLRDLPGEWCENYDLWVDSCFAMHHEFSGSARAFTLWDTWSQKSLKYDKENTVKKWDSAGKADKGARAELTMLTLLQAVAPIRAARREADIETLFSENAIEIGNTIGNESCPIARHLESRSRSDYGAWADIDCI